MLVRVCRVYHFFRYGLFGPFGRLFRWRADFDHWCRRRLPCSLGFHFWQIPFNGIGVCEKCWRLHPRELKKLGMGG